MITAQSGPLVAFGLTQSSTGGNGITGNVADYNGQRGPSLFDLGIGLADPRQAYAYAPGAAVTQKVYGLVGGLGVVDFVPAAVNSSAFLISSNTVSTGFISTAFTLLSSQTGVTATTIIAPETNAVTGTLLCIDSTATGLAFGTDGTVSLWNPAAGAGRGISITTSSSGERGGISVYGRDAYGFEITETLYSTDATRASTNSSGLTLTTRKAFKYVGSIVGSSTITSTGIGAGFSDRFGFPLQATYVGGGLSVRYLPTAYSSGVAVVALTSANTILGSTVTATSTTDDVRGTYTSTTATDGTARIQVYVTPTAAALNAISASDVSGLFGPTQYSST